MTQKREPRQVIGAETMSSAMPLAVEYHQWFFELVEPHLGNRILDIGSGLGNHLQFFEGRDLTCLDLSPECVARLEKEFGGTNRDFVAGDICDDNVAESLSSKGIDTVTCLNVLEHIEDDRQALTNIHKVLKPTGGTFIVIVPAHEFLYGEMDSLAGHYRRLSKGQLSGLLRECGFEVEVARYVNAIGAFGWFINGRIMKPKSLSNPSINTQLVFFSRVFVPMIKRLENKLSPPFGQSLMVVAKAI